MDEGKKFKLGLVRGASVGLPPWQVDTGRVSESIGPFLILHKGKLRLGEGDLTPPRLDWDFGADEGLLPGPGTLGTALLSTAASLSVL